MYFLYILLSKVIIEIISQDQNLNKIIPIVNILQNYFFKALYELAISIHYHLPVLRIASLIFTLALKNVGSVE